MEHQENITEANDRYVLKRIVYVNSATHGYSEIEIDKHMALFGKNNRGKTASLAGLKLALYPELSFTNCESKFRFVGKDGNYSKEDSYKFYFPSYQSYIVTEVQNPQGIFCMVLFKAKGEWEYGRLFVPVNFDTLRSIFWDSNTRSLQANLQYKDIEKQLKSRGGFAVTSTAEIAKLLYAGHSGNLANSQFCMLPLTDSASTAAIDAFRNLYQLAFDIGQTDKKTLPKAIATIIEMRRSRPAERLSAELDNILAAYDELSKNKEALITIENTQARWNRLLPEYQAYGSAKKEIARQVAGYFAYIESELAVINERCETNDAAYEICVEKHTAARSKFFQVSQQLEQSSGALKAERKRYEGKRQDCQTALELFNQYPGHTADQVIDILQDELNICQRKLAAFSSEEASRRELESLITKKNQYSTERERIKHWLEHDRRGLLDLLEPSSADIMYSINSTFSSLHLSDDKESLNAMNEFSNHFEVRESRLYYHSQRTDIEYRLYDREQTRKENKQRFDQLRNDIFDLDNQIEELGKSIHDGEKRADNKKHCEKESKECETLIRLAKGFDTNKIDRDEAEVEIQRLEKCIDELREGKEKLETDVQLLDAEKHKLGSFKQDSALRRSDLTDWQTRLKQVSDRAYLELPIDHDNSVSSLSRTEINRLEGDIDSLVRSRALIYQEVMNIVRELDFKNGNDAFKAVMDELELSNLINQLHQVYLELPDKRKLYENAVFAHNNNITSQLQELREAKDTLVKFVEDLNQDVNRHKVSNLQEVRLHLIINARFEQLMTDLKKYDLMQGDLVDRQFYDRLNTFCREFFQGKNGKHRALNLEQLIDAIQYHYKLEGADKFESKSQSGGTTSTTTALILAILLKKISPSYVSVGIPIIVDEIGTLDGNNKKAAIETVASHGFAVFCATPVPEPAVMEGIGRWIIIDQFRLEKPQVANCSTLILPECVQSFSRESEALCV